VAHVKAQKKNADIPFNAQSALTMMVKPSIMRIIIACRAQYAGGEMAENRPPI